MLALAGSDGVWFIVVSAEVLECETNITGHWLEKMGNPSNMLRCSTDYNVETSVLRCNLLHIVNPMEINHSEGKTTKRRWTLSPDCMRRCDVLYAAYLKTPTLMADELYAASDGTVRTNPSSECV